MLQILTLVLAQAYPPPFPREGATKLIENERVVVWEVEWQKGRKTAMHEHKLDLVGVFLADGQTRIVQPDGTSRVSEHSPLGEVTFGARGVIHSEEGVSETPRRAILVELKDAHVEPVEPRPGTPVAFPREGARKLLENDRLLVWGYEWTPGTRIPVHFHDKDVVVVWLAPGKLRSMPVDGEPTVSTRRFGEVTFNPRNRVHSEESIEGTSPRQVIIELK